MTLSEDTIMYNNGLYKCDDYHYDRDWLIELIENNN